MRRSSSTPDASDASSGVQRSASFRERAPYMAVAHSAHRAAHAHGIDRRRPGERTFTNAPPRSCCLAPLPEPRTLVHSRSIAASHRWAAGTAQPSLTSPFASRGQVGSTGPRMLEPALREWEVAHGVGSSARAYVAPADAFYPLWDAGQAGTFQERCSWSGFLNSSEIASQRLGPMVLATCARLQAEGFVPRTYNSSFAAQ